MPVPARLASLAFLAFVLALTPGVAAPVYSQFVKIEAGASDLLPAAGGGITFESSRYTSYLSAGTIDGAFSLGAYVKTSIASHPVTAGDQAITFDLPTDIFGENYLFMMRGIGTTIQQGKANLFLLGGATAEARGVPFFQAARADSAAGALFADAPLSDKIHFYSRSVISREPTSIEALAWRPRKWFQGALSGGIGSNQPYFAATTDMENDWLSLKAAYISASDRFRRLTEPSVFASEVDRENFLADIKPRPGMLLTLGHQNYLQAESPDSAAPFLRAAVNQIQSTFDLAEFRLGAGLFESSSQMRSNLAAAFSASRPVTKSVDLTLNYFRALSGTNSSESNLSISVRETLSPRLSLLQVANDSNGHWNILYGGSYLSNRFTLSVDYQTLYLPFGPNYFSQGISVVLSFRLGPVHMNLQTFRSADGRLRYTASADSSMTPTFHPLGISDDIDMPFPAARARTGGYFGTMKHLRFIARGYVRDDMGQPVEGAAIRVGDQVLFTNADGEFFTRLRKPSTLPLEVVFSEFLNPANFRIVSAPVTIVASPDGSSSEALIVLGRE